MKLFDYFKKSKQAKSRISQAYSSGLSRGVCLILIFSAVLCLSSCGRWGASAQKKTYYEFFDTVCTVSYYGNRGADYFEETAEFIEEELEGYHRLFDAYHEYAGMKNLCSVNSSAGIAPVAVDSSLFELIAYGKEVYALTGGEVNIAFGAVTSLWKEAQKQADGQGTGNCLPTREALTEASGHTSIDIIVLDREKSTVYLSDSYASLDVGAIGKGFAAERIAESLKARGDESFVLDLGGNIRVIGSKPDGSGWITGIENPNVNSTDAFIARVELIDESCVTSGDYRRYFIIDGKRYHHIIDRDTLYPAELFSSVTVIASDSGLCDALSTALFCMPLEEGRALLSGLDGVEAIWVTRDGEVIWSDERGA